MIRVLILTFARFYHAFNLLKTVEKGIKPRWQWLKNILKGLAFVFEPFLKSEIMAKIDRYGKGLVFTFCSILAIFSTF